MIHMLYMKSRKLVDTLTSRRRQKITCVDKIVDINADSQDNVGLIPEGLIQASALKGTFMHDH